MSWLNSFDMRALLYYELNVHSVHVKPFCHCACTFRMGQFAAQIFTGGETHGFHYGQLVSAAMRAMLNTRGVHGANEIEVVFE